MPRKNYKAGFLGPSMGKKSHGRTRPGRRGAALSRRTMRKKGR